MTLTKFRGLSSVEDLQEGEVVDERVVQPNDVDSLLDESARTDQQQSALNELVSEEIRLTLTAIRAALDRPRTVLHALLLEDALDLEMISAAINQDPLDIERILEPLERSGFIVRLGDTASYSLAWLPLEQTEA